MKVSLLRQSGRELCRRSNSSLCVISFPLMTPLMIDLGIRPRKLTPGRKQSNEGSVKERLKFGESCGGAGFSDRDCWREVRNSVSISCDFVVFRAISCGFVDRF